MEEDSRRREFYARLLSECTGLVEGETDVVANTANIASLLYHEMNRFRVSWVNWVGFYFVKERGDLVLGPFHGKLPRSCNTVGRFC